MKNKTTTPQAPKFTNLKPGDTVAATDQVKFQAGWQTVPEALVGLKLDASHKPFRRPVKK